MKKGDILGDGSGNKFEIVSISSLNGFMSVKAISGTTVVVGNIYSDCDPKWFKLIEKAHTGHHLTNIFK